CLKCAAENEPSSKFCEDCGAALTAASPSTRVGEAAHRQGEIRLAAPLNDTSALDGERKTVTALFADIKGSMELMVGPRPRRSASHCRPCTQADDRRRQSLRRVHRSIDR